MGSVKDKKESEVDLFWSFINGHEKEENSEKSEDQAKQRNSRKTEDEEKRKNLESSKPERFVVKKKNNDLSTIAKDSGRSAELELKNAMQRLDDLEAFDVKDESNEDSEIETFIRSGKQEITMDGDFQGHVRSESKAVQKKTQDKRTELPVEEKPTYKQNPEPAEEKMGTMRKMSWLDSMFSRMLGDKYETVGKVMILITYGVGIFTIGLLHYAFSILKSIPVVDD